MPRHLLPVVAPAASTPQEFIALLNAALAPLLSQRILAVEIVTTDTVPSFARTFQAMIDYEDGGFPMSAPYTVDVLEAVDQVTLAQLSDAYTAANAASFVAPVQYRYTDQLPNIQARFMAFYISSTDLVDGQRNYLVSGGGGGGGGSVTFVGFTAPASIFSVGGAPIIAAGVIALGLVAQAAATFFAGPAIGAAAVPTFRAMALTDLPAIPFSSITSTPTTLAGYGIVDAAPLSHVGSYGVAQHALADAAFEGFMPALSGAPTQYLDGSGAWSTPSGAGSVTSVGLASPSQFNVSGSPVTGAGTLTFDWNNQTANFALMGPTAGGAAAPTFRAMVIADLPAIPFSYLTSTPTTLAGYGIVDAAPLSHVGAGGVSQHALATVAAAGFMPVLSNSATQYLDGTGNWSIPAGSGTGTVTSVGLAAPAQFNVTGSPVTAAGTLTFAWNNQAANVVLAGPASGGAAPPTFRALVIADLPVIPFSYITTTPTTLAGYGIADAAPLSHVGSNGVSQHALATSGAAGFLPALSNSATQYLDGTGNWTVPAGSGGTVTSVALNTPAELNVAGSPVTGAGAFTLTWANQAQNSVFAGLTLGSGVPAFRALVLADLPAIPFSSITSTPTTLAGYGIVDAAPLSHVGSIGVSQHALASVTDAGFLPILSNSATQYLDGTGNWTVPAGSGVSGSGTANQVAFWSSATALTSAATFVYTTATGLSVTRAGSATSEVIGLGAGLVMAGVFNAVFGQNAAAAMTTGSSIVAVGTSAMGNSTTLSDSVAVGPSAMLNSLTGQFNVAVGTNAMSNATGMLNCVGVGHSALRNATGNFHVAVGSNALNNTTSAVESVAVGYRAAQSATTGGQNVAVGSQAGAGNVAGFGNVSVGWNARQVPTSGNRHVAIGYEAMKSGAGGGDSNIAIGFQSMQNVVSISNSVAIGTGTLRAASSDAAVAVGHESQLFVTTGSSNVSVGALTLRANSTGSNNTVVGHFALDMSTSSDNTAVGAFALAALVSGTRNAAFGLSSLTTATGSDNSAFGARSFENLTTGERNVAVGHKAGFTHLTGSHNIFIGNESGDSTATGASNRAVFGSVASPITSVFFGNGELAGSPQPVVCQVTGGSGTDIAGASITIAGGRGTGAGVGGAVRLATAKASGTGSVANTLVDYWGVLQDGATEWVGIAAAPAVSTANDATVYYDSGLQELMLSKNGGAYVAFSAGAGIGGAGTVDVITKWTGATTVGDSLLSVSSTTVTLTGGVTATNTSYYSIASINDFLQYDIKNTSAGTSAQTAYSVTSDVGTLTSGFMSIGINNSTFTAVNAYSIGVAGDTSVLSSSNTLYIANASDTAPIIFSTGKIASPFFDERLRISPNAGTGAITATVRSLTYTQVVGTGSVTGFVMTGAAHIALTASTESIDFNLNLARTVQFATGALATQRAVVIQAPTYSAVGASVMTTGATLTITGAPIQGTNMTITTPLALDITAGVLRTAASTATVSGFRLPHGAAPTTPVNGDFWTLTTAVQARLNGATVSLVSGTGTTNRIVTWAGANTLGSPATLTLTTTSGAALFAHAAGTSTATTTTAAALHSVTFSGAATTGPLNCFSSTATSTGTIATAGISVNGALLAAVSTPGGAVAAINYVGAAISATATSAANANHANAAQVGTLITPTFNTANTTGVTVLARQAGVRVTNSIVTTNASGVNTIPDVYGIWVTPGTFSSTGGGGLTITNFYGLRIDTLTLTTMTVTNRFGIFQADTLAMNSFAGALLVGGGLADNNVASTSWAAAGSLTIAAGVWTTINSNTATIASFTVTAPAAPIKGQVIYITTSGEVTAFGFNANAGQTVSGGNLAITLTADTSVRFIFSGTVWYRI